MHRHKTVIIVLFLTGSATLGGMWFWRAFHSAKTTVPITSVASLATTNTVMETAADRAIHHADAEVAAQPQKGSGYVSLAVAYMQKARETGDASYYGRAEAAVRQALLLEQDSPEALRTLAWIQTGKHEFREALETATHLQTQRPNDPLVYGLLGDAAIELGEYEQAEAAFQKMLDLRPGLASYSRAAYLLELYGKQDEAVQFMEQAVKAGSASDPEPLAWCLVQLGSLYFNQGRLGKAETAYHNALALFPHYYHALAALGRVRGAQQRYEEAIDYYRQAVAIVPAPDLLVALGDLFAFVGKTDEAEKQYALVEYIEQVNTANQVAYNRQLALFYADHERNLDDAVKLAETEIQRRQDIYSYDALAWVYYKKGRFAEAQNLMTRALRLGTQDALLLFHAGMIARARGEHAEAKDYIRRALDTNPYFSLQDRATAYLTLAELERQDVVQGENHAR